MSNLAKAKHAIENTVVMTDDEIREYCARFVGLVTEEDVLFKGI